MERLVGMHGQGAPRIRQYWKITVFGLGIESKSRRRPQRFGQTRARESEVARGSVNRELLAKTLNLAPGRKIILAQTVGYPPRH